MDENNQDQKTKTLDLGEEAKRLKNMKPADFLREVGSVIMAVGPRLTDPFAIVELTGFMEALALAINVVEMGVPAFLERQEKEIKENPSSVSSSVEEFAKSLQKKYSNLRAGVSKDGNIFVGGRGGEA